MHGRHLRFIILTPILIIVTVVTFSAYIAYHAFDIPTNPGPSRVPAQPAPKAR
ncbi:MAG: hypothetical protein Q8R30_05410 [bacterium]|nr:hypothetical protein [bacterium]